MGKRTEYNKKYYNNHREYYKQKQKEWRDNNPQHLKELKQKSYQRNRDKTIHHVKEYRNKNLSKILQKHKENYKKNPDLFKNRRMKYKYGITSEQKEVMFQSQEQKCLICSNTFPINELFIDHNHITNKIRGLLCCNCNSVLGFAKDSPFILLNAVKYLIK